MDTKYNYQLFAAHEIILTFLDQNNGVDQWAPAPLYVILSGDPCPKTSSLLSAAPLLSRDRHSGSLLICTFPDAAVNGFMSPPGIKPGSFCLLGKCVNHYTVYPLCPRTSNIMNPSLEQ